MSSAATDRRPPSQHSFASLLPLNTIINDNEFPTLGARGTPSSGGFSPLPTTSSSFVTQLSQSPLPFKDQGLNHSRNYATLMRNNDQLNNPEFQIQNEDFPALPGALGTGPSDLNATLHSLNQTPDMLAAVGPLQHDSLSKLPDDHGGIKISPNGEVSNIPPSMLADQFGMAGLVANVRLGGGGDRNLCTLANGEDLTLLGLNLNQLDFRRNLYTTFSGPFSRTPIRPIDLDVKVPEEYLTMSQIREKLPTIKMAKFSEDVLFFLFYNCPGELYQMQAANELYNRDWRYHKTEGTWLTRSQYGQTKEQTTTYEKGQYNVFDPLQWRKIPKELKLEYKELDDKPMVPGFPVQAGSSTQPSTAGGIKAPQQRHNT